MSRIVMDESTGVVTAVMNPGDRILRKESKEHLARMWASDIKNRHFVRVDEEEGRLVAMELDQAEKAVLFQLQFYVSYASGLIAHPNGREIGFADVVEMTGLSRATAAQALESLLKKDIIYKGRNSRKVQYYMNPWVASKGIVPNETLKDMFRNYRVRSKGNVAWKDL